MKLIIDISEDVYKRCCVMANVDGSTILQAIKNGIPLEDILQIIDNAKWMNKVLQGQSNIEADTPSCDTCKYQSAQFNPCNGCNDKSEYMPRAVKE